MADIRHLPSFDRSTPRDLPALPAGSHELGPQHGLVFATMHMSTASICLYKGVIPPPRDLALDADHVVLGYPEAIARRLRTSLPLPYQGTIGDAVGLTMTPHTMAAFGSYRPIATSGAVPVDVGDMAVAVVALDLLLDARLPMLFSDRSPIGSGVVMSSSIALDDLPWHRIRSRQLSLRVGDPLEAARYEAEILVQRCVPLAAVRLFAVHDERAADRLRAVAALADRHCPIEVRPGFFFGGR